MSQAMDEAELIALYQDLHAHPELGFHETRTAALIAERLAGFGFEVHAGVGGTGVVGILDNGPGPTALLRADMDALPVLEADRARVRQQRPEESAPRAMRCRSCTRAATTCT